MRDDGFDADFARSGEEATRRIAMACPDALVIAEELADIDGAARIPTVVVRQTEAVFPAPRDGSRPPATSGPHVAWPIELATLYAELDGAIRRSIRIAI